MNCNTLTAELVEAVQEGMDMLAGKIAPSRTWHPPAEVDVCAIGQEQGCLRRSSSNALGSRLPP